MPHAGKQSERRFPRLAVAAVLLFAHLVATFGWPFPVYASGKPTDPRGAYPCSDHPCGCATYDACWAGDCCCFTLAEKIAWAGANGVAVPNHVPALMAPKPKKAGPPPKKSVCCLADHKTCCEPEPAAEPEPPKARRVIGIFAAKCRGLKLGFGALDPARPAADDSPSLECPAGDRPAAAVVHFTSFTSPPPSPPPNLG